MLLIARVLLVGLAPAATFAACEVAGWLADVPLLRDTRGYQGAQRMERCHSAADAVGNCTAGRLRRRGDPYTIAVLGGSSVFGYPAGTPSFVPRLRNRLEAVAPGRFHVVNFGLYCKDTLYVRACAEGLLGPDLDLLVVYAGHNDFANWMGAWPRVTMFAEENPWVFRVRDGLAGTRAYSLTVSLLRKPAALFGEYSRPPLDVFESTSRTILDAYAANLEAVLDDAAAADIPVLLVTLVSNLYEHPYREDVWDTALAPVQQPDPVADWRAPFAAGVSAHRAGRGRRPRQPHLEEMHRSERGCAARSLAEEQGGRARALRGSRHQSRAKPRGESPRLGAAFQDLHDRRRGRSGPRGS